MCGGGGSRRRQQIRLEIRETIIEARDEREKRESPSIRKIEAGWEAGNRPRASSQAGSEVDCSRKLHFSQRSVLGTTSFKDCVRCETISVQNLKN